MILTLEQQYMLSVLHSQFHACWCSGDFRSQGISRYGIDPQSQNIPSPASEELNNIILPPDRVWPAKIPHGGADLPSGVLLYACVRQHQEAEH